MAADDSSTTSTEFIFLGTGTSSSLPHLDCLTAPPGKKPCRTCLSTLTPEGKKNIRRNTSAVMRIKGKDEQMACVRSAIFVILQFVNSLAPPGRLL